MDYYVKYNYYAIHALLYEKILREFTDYQKEIDLILLKRSIPNNVVR